MYVHYTVLSKELLDYLAQNPGLDGGKIIRVEMHLRLDAVDEFVDSFGTDFGSNDGIRTQLIGERLPRGYCRASLCASSDYVLKSFVILPDKTDYKKNNNWCRVSYCR